MPFEAGVKTVGVPDFGLVHIDVQETAKAFQTYLETASNLTGVDLNDIQRNVLKLPDNPSKATLVDLLAVGMKLFDAVIWLTAGRPPNFPLLEDPAMKPEAVNSLHNVARAVFYCYFMLLTQARYPVSRDHAEKPKIPNFLTTIMGMSKPQHEYVETICSFEPQKFNPAWVRYVKFQNFGQEVLSRFGLGVAGYRLFGPFGIYPAPADISPALVEPFNFARTLAKSAVTWDIHPLTRNPNVLKARGNLNKNLANLILDVYSEEQIDQMVTARVLYKKPERDLAHQNYRTWSSEDDISGKAKIFIG